MTQHTRIPWHKDPDLPQVVTDDHNPRVIATCQRSVDAQFVVRACNAHDALVAACEAAKCDLTAAIDRLPKRFTDHADYERCMALFDKLEAALALANTPAEVKP